MPFLNIYLEFFLQTDDLIAIMELLQKWEIVNNYFKRKIYLFFY